MMSPNQCQILLFLGYANDAAQYKSVQVSTSAQCPIRDIPPSSQQIKFGYPTRF
ncbi:MAG: hypothetical protein ACYTX0_59560 [Nostoc sp.]